VLCEPGWVTGSIGAGANVWRTVWNEVQRYVGDRGLPPALQCCVAITAVQGQVRDATGSAAWQSRRHRGSQGCHRTAMAVHVCGARSAAVVLLCGAPRFPAFWAWDAAAMQLRGWLRPLAPRGGVSQPSQPPPCWPQRIGAQHVHCPGASAASCVGCPGRPLPSRGPSRHATAQT
jgi:hypothetical protein